MIHIVPHPFGSIFGDIFAGTLHDDISELDHKFVPTPETAPADKEELESPIRLAFVFTFFILVFTLVVVSLFLLFFAYPKKK